MDVRSFRDHKEPRRASPTHAEPAHRVPSVTSGTRPRIVGGVSATRTGLHSKHHGTSDALLFPHLQRAERRGTTAARAAAPSAPWSGGDPPLSCRTRCPRFARHVCPPAKPPHLFLAQTHTRRCSSGAAYRQLGPMQRWPRRQRELRDFRATLSEQEPLFIVDVASR